jgi:hypothetical protein
MIMDVDQHKKYEMGYIYTNSRKQTATAENNFCTPGLLAVEPKKKTLILETKKAHLSYVNDALLNNFQFMTLAEQR